MIGLIYIISVFMVTCVTGADIYYDTVARGAYNFGAGPITVHSGATWSIVNNANSAFISSLHVEQDARFFVTSISPLISSTVTLLGVINSIVNDGLISFSAHPLSKDSHYNLLGASFKNNGEMYLTGAGDSDMFLDSIFWENNGLLVFAQYQRTKQNINTGIPLGSIRNNGQICLFNKTFKQTLHDIEGSGCITAEENSAIYLANIQRTISTKQKFQLTDSKSSFIVEPYISKRVFKVEGFGQRAGGASNIISINRAIDRGEWSYDSNTGVLYIGNFLRSAYFNIGKGYDKSKFAIVDLNIVEMDFVSRGALAYNGPVPNPSYPCQKCKRAPVDPGAQPTQVLTTITQTTNGAISEQTRLINIEVDDYGLFQYETVDYTPVESTTSTELLVTESDVIELMSTTTMTNSSTSSVSLGINYDMSTLTETSSNGYPVESESGYNAQGEMRSDYLELSITAASVPESISTDSTNGLEISSEALSVDFETSSTELDSAYNSDVHIEKQESVSSDVSFVHPATQSMVYKSSFVVDSSSGFNTLAIVSSSTEDQVAEITLLATTSEYSIEASQASFYNSSVGLHSSLVSDKTNVDSSVYMNSNYTSMVTETDDYMTSATPETATTGANSTVISTQGLSSLYSEETDASYLAKATPTTETTPYSSSSVLSSSTAVLLNSSDAHYYFTNASSIESITEFATLTTVNPLVGANSQDNIESLTFSSTNSTVSDVVAKAAGAANFSVEISFSSTISQIVQTDTPNEPLLESTVGGIDSNTIEAVSIPISSASIDSLSSDATTTYMPVSESDSTSSFSSVNEPVTSSFAHLNTSTDEIVSGSSTRSSSSTMSSWSVTYSEVSESAVVSSVVTNTTLGSSLTESLLVSSSPVASSTMTESALVESTTSSQPSTTASRSSQGQQSASTMSESLPSFSTMSDSLSSSSTMSESLSSFPTLSESLSSFSTSLAAAVHLQSSESSTTEYYVASQTDSTSSDANTDERFAVTESAWDFHFTNTSTTTEALLTEVTKAASSARVEATAGLTGDVSEIQDNDNGVTSEGVSSASSSTEVDSKTVSSSTEAGASKTSSSTEADSNTDSPSASHHVIPALSNGNTSEAGSSTPTNASKASSNMYTVTTNVVVASSTSNSRAPSVLAPHITTYESSGSLIQFSLSSLVALFATILVSFHL